MRDPTHQEFIHRWAAHVKENIDWKREHSDFINAQYTKHLELVERLEKTPQGREKLRQIYKR